MVDNQYIDEFYYEMEIFNPSYHTGGSLDFMKCDLPEIYANGEDNFYLYDEMDKVDINIREYIEKQEIKNDVLYEEAERSLRLFLYLFVKTLTCIYRYSEDHGKSVDALTNIDVELLYEKYLPEANDYWIQADAIDGTLDMIPQDGYSLFEYFINTPEIQELFPFIKRLSGCVCPKTVDELRNIFRIYYEYERSYPYGKCEASIRHFIVPGSFYYQFGKTEDASVSDYMHNKRTDDDIFDY